MLDELAKYGMPPEVPDVRPVPPPLTAKVPLPGAAEPVTSDAPMMPWHKPHKPPVDVLRSNPRNLCCGAVICC